MVGELKSAARTAADEYKEEMAKHERQSATSLEELQKALTQRESELASARAELSKRLVGPASAVSSALSGASSTEMYAPIPADFLLPTATLLIVSVDA